LFWMELGITVVWCDISKRTSISTINSVVLKREYAVVCVMLAIFMSVKEH
jgi:hypothetical protein